MNDAFPRAGHIWSVEDDVELRSRISKRQTAAAIAKGMGRTVDAIRGRAAALHITLPSSQRPWRSFPEREPRAPPTDASPPTPPDPETHR